MTRINKILMLNQVGYYTDKYSLYVETYDEDGGSYELVAEFRL